MRNCRISGWGTWLPDTAVTFTSRSGTVPRYRIADDVSQLDMLAAAAGDAIRRAGITADDVDCVIAACAAGVQPIPCTAALVMERVAPGARAAAFDVNSTCTSFITAVDIASRYLADGEYERVLIVSGDVGSRFLDPEQRESYELFSDAAAAVVLTRGDEGQGVLASLQQTWPEHAHDTELRGGLSRFPAHDYADGDPADYRFDMHGRRALMGCCGCSGVLRAVLREVRAHVRGRRPGRPAPGQRRARHRHASHRDPARRLRRRGRRVREHGVLVGAVHAGARCLEDVGSAPVTPCCCAARPRGSPRTRWRCGSERAHHRTGGTVRVRPAPPVRHRTGSRRDARGARPGAAEGPQRRAERRRPNRAESRRATGGSGTGFVSTARVGARNARSWSMLRFDRPSSRTGTRRPGTTCSGPGALPRVGSDVVAGVPGVDVLDHGVDVDDAGGRHDGGDARSVTGDVLDEVFSHEGLLIAVRTAVPMRERTTGHGRNRHCFRWEGYAVRSRTVRMIRATKAGVRNGRAAGGAPGRGRIGSRQGRRA